MQTIKTAKLIFMISALSVLYGTVAAQDEVTVPWTVCGSSTEITGLLKNGANRGEWECVSHPGVVQFKNAGSPTTVVSNMPFNEQVVILWVTYDENNLCQSLSSRWVTNVKPDPAVFYSATPIACDGTAIFVCAAQSGVNYSWTIPQGSRMDDNSQYPGYARVSDLPNGENTITVDVYLDGNKETCSTPSSVTITSGPVDIGDVPSTLYSCDESYLLTVDPPKGVNPTGSWSAPNGSGLTFDNEGSHCTLVHNLAEGKNQVTWTVTNGSCTDSKTIDLYYEPLDVTANDLISHLDFIELVGSIPSDNQTGRWSVVGDQGDIVLYSPDVFRCPVDHLPEGVTTFRWTVSNGQCSSYADAKVRYVNSKVNVSSTVCGSSTEITGSLSGADRGEWQCISHPGVVKIQNAESPTTVVSNLPFNEEVILLWFTFVDNQNVSYSSGFVTNVKPDPAVFYSAEKFCDGTAIFQCGAQSGVNYSWTIPKGSSMENQYPNLALVSDLPNGENTITVDVYLDGNKETCSTSSSASVNIDRLEIGDMPSTLYSCETSYFLTANTRIDGKTTGKWSAESGSGLKFENAGSNSTMVHNLAEGKNTITWTVTNGSCSKSATIDLYYEPISVDAQNLVVNVNNAQLSGSVPSKNQTGRWSVVGSQGGIILYSPDVARCPVAYLPKGVTTFRWTVSTEHCSASAVATVQYISPAITASAYVCGESAEISASAPPSGFTGYWTTTNASVRFANPSSRTTTVSGLPSGVDVELIWTITDSKSAFKVQHTIQNVTPEKPQIITKSQDICDRFITLLAQPSSSNIISYWSTTGKGVFVGDTLDAVVTLSDLSKGKNQVFRKAFYNGHPDCEQYSSISITNNAVTAELLNMPSEVNSCDDYYPLSAKAPGAGESCFWSVSPDAGATIDMVSSCYTVVRNLNYGTKYSLTWTISKGSCADSKTVNITSYKVSADAGADQTVEIPIAQLNGSRPMSPKWYWTVVDNQANIVFDESTALKAKVSNLPAGKTKFRWTVANDYCTASDEVEITYNAPVITAPSEVCSDEADLSVTSTNYHGFWTSDDAYVYFSDISLTKTKVLRLPSGKKVTLYWNLMDGNKVVSTTAHAITSTALQPTVANANISTTNSRAMIAANEPPANVTSYHWEIVSAGANTTIDNSNALETKVRNLIKGDLNVFKFVVENDKCSGSATVVVNNDSIVKSLNESDVEILLSNTSYTYTGSALEPEVTVKDGSELLDLITDYTVTYQDNIAAGTAKAIITGQGNYSDVVEKEFTIDTKNAVAACQFEKSSYTYTGSPIEPVFAVKVGEETVPADDYTVAFSDNINAGEGKVSVASKEGANYTFSLDATFTIAKAPLTVTALDTSMVFGDIPNKDTVVISGFLNDDDIDILSGSLEYTSSYRLGDNIGDYTITAKGLSADNYELIYVPGKLTVTQKSIEDLEIAFSLAQIRFNGTAQTPALSVNYGGTILSASTDYTVEYTDNTEVGTAKVKITGKGNYTGTLDGEFTILEATAPYLSFEPEQQFTFTGSEIKPAVVVMHDDEALPETYYTVTYTDNVNAGTAKIKVVSTEEFFTEFSFDASFTILPADISSANVSTAVSPVPYTGFEVNPDFVVTVGDNSLEANTDYIVEYADNIEIGTGKAVLTGIGNYKGTVSTEFEIKRVAVALRISTLPKLQYVLDEEFDYNGGSLVLEYSDATTLDLLFTDAEISGFYSDKIGPQSVEVSYDGVSVDLAIMVSEKAVAQAQIPELKDNVYQLSNSEQLFWFIIQVNNGNNSINGELTEDVVINKDCLSRLSLSKKENEDLNFIVWQPIGTPTNPFQGSFNGQGHTISGIYINGNTNDNVGLFGTIAEDAVVKNVGVVDSYVKGDKNVGALCGNNKGTIVNCYNTSIVVGNENVGGISGSMTKEAIVANSYSVGKATTTDGEEQGVSGVATENVQNCFYLTEKTDNTNTQAKTAAEFKSGEVAKTLVEGAKTLAEEKENDPTFVLDIFEVDVVLPGVEDIKIPDPIIEPEDPENPETPVSEVSNSNVRIWSYANTIFVENADKDIYVVSLSGTTIKKASPESSRIEISISNPGVYIVKTGKVSKKVLIQ